MGTFEAVPSQESKSPSAPRRHWACVCGCWVPKAGGCLQAPDPKMVARRLRPWHRPPLTGWLSVGSEARCHQARAHQWPGALGILACEPQLARRPPGWTSRSKASMLPWGGSLVLALRRSFTGQGGPGARRCPRNVSCGCPTFPTSLPVPPELACPRPRLPAWRGLAPWRTEGAHAAPASGRAARGPFVGLERSTNSPESGNLSGSPSSDREAWTERDPRRGDSANKPRPVCRADQTPSGRREAGRQMVSVLNGAERGAGAPAEPGLAAARGEPGGRRGGCPCLPQRPRRALPVRSGPSPSRRGPSPAPGGCHKGQMTRPPWRGDGALGLSENRPLNLDPWRTKANIHQHLDVRHAPRGSSCRVSSSALNHQCVGPDYGSHCRGGETETQKDSVAVPERNQVSGLPPISQCPSEPHGGPPGMLPSGSLIISQHVL